MNILATFNQIENANTRICDPYKLLERETPQYANCLSHALDADFIQQQQRQNFTLVNSTSLSLDVINVLRYKPSRRCLIEYQFSDNLQNQINLLGKIRFKGFDKHAYRINRTLWEQGFNLVDNEKIRIPEPVSAILPCNMWLQRKIIGHPLLPFLSSENAENWGYRVAEAAHKLNRANIVALRHHTIADELQILHERLSKLCHLKPKWNARLTDVLMSCYEIASELPVTKPVGIHRDYYHDQFIVSKDTLYIFDLDLYCAGDAALDIGNFIGHTMEYSLRKSNDPNALKPAEEAIIDRFLQLNPNYSRETVESYITLTLARHIQISTRFEDRKAYTEQLLGLCEQRLGLRQIT